MLRLHGGFLQRVQFCVNAEVIRLSSQMTVWVRVGLETSWLGLFPIKILVL